MKTARVCGHLGELLQGRLGPQGPVVLITLPAPNLSIAVSCRQGPFYLYQPKGTAIQRPVFHALLQKLGFALRGRWIIHAHMPICPYAHMPIGAGASTATILAVIKVLRPDMPRGVAERICLTLEGASDPLLASSPEQVLWASRQGRSMGKLPKLPAMQVVGGFLLGHLRTDPREDDFPDIGDLVAQWPQACESPQALGRWFRSPRFGGWGMTKLKPSV